jgi:hypothetical protein
MSAIDFHTHAFPDDLAGRAIAKLEAGAGWKAVAGGTVAELVRSMDRSGVDASVVCAIATRPDQVQGIIQWCERIRSNRIIPLPSVHPEDGGALKHLREIAKEGFVGIKLHPMYQDFAADEPRMEAIYSETRDNGLVLVMHCGQDIAFGPDDDRASPARVRKIVDRFKGLILVCTHMGGWRAWDQVERHLVGSEAYFETSFSIPELTPQRAADIIRRHGAERVLLGSDWPWNSQEDAIDQVNRLSLEDMQKGKILCSNAARLLL